LLNTLLFKGYLEILYNLLEENPYFYKNIIEDSYLRNSIIHLSFYYSDNPLVYKVRMVVNAIKIL